MSGRLAKWAVEISALTIIFKPRTAMKGQVIADFLAEIPTEYPVEVNGDSENMAEDQTFWNLYTDGAANSNGVGLGVLLVSPEGKEITQALKLNFKASNNETEYEALIAGLRLAIKQGVLMLRAHVDSLLVANQVNNIYEAKEDSMNTYLNICRELITQFAAFTMIHVPRSKNKKADALSKLASCFDKPEIQVKEVGKPATSHFEVLETDQQQTTWMSPIIEYLERGTLPEGEAQASKLKNKAIHYQTKDGVLYRRTYLGPLLRCVDSEEASYLIREIHLGVCGIHAGPRSVVAKIINAGYYWPGMHATAEEELKKCFSCQKHAPLTIRPKNNLVPVYAAWPFQKWAVDIVGPLPEGPGKLKHLIVAVDYFTKWAEAKAVTAITTHNVKKFLWDNVVCRFGIPLYLVSDNGAQFIDCKMKEWCDSLKIKQIFTSVAHPQGNGQVERVNRSIVEGLKKRLGEAGATWIDELPNVLWAFRTMIKTSTGETPFSLTYGSEAMIPAEIGLPSIGTQGESEDNNDELIRRNLDLLEERREIAAINEARYKKKLEQEYNKNVSLLSFKEEDYVLRDNSASRIETQGKLGPNWEGPYQIHQVKGKGAYTLKQLDGKILPRTWNVAKLRRCYM
ncbi:hypothetical protein QVD17_20082 [Tagetes erecta]|uniref:Uncharacterized protein n=1 Tax=Tagetes erecta TaxID=13708 RepID=A0AAD8NXV3_TARER|nr:hypothetical protein QVD17_20082 [Tagetes erecta]